MAQENPNAALFDDDENPNLAVFAEAPPPRVDDPRRHFGRAAGAVQPSPTTFQPEKGQSPQEIGARAVAQAPLTAAQMVGERVLGQPEGQMKAAFRASAGEETKGSGGYGRLARIGKTMQFMFPKLGGRAPNRQELKAAATRDPNLALVVGMIEQAEVESASFSKEFEAATGKPVDWGAIERDFIGAVEQEQSARAQSGDKSMQPGNINQLTAMLGQRHIPGLTRPPLTEKEGDEVIWSIIKQAESGEMAALPNWTKAIADGLAGGVHIAATAPLGGLLGSQASSAMRGGVQFGALSAETQLLAVASGAQPEFSVLQVGAETALGAFSSFVGGKLAEKYLNKQVTKFAGMDPQLVPVNGIQKAQAVAQRIAGGGTIGTLEMTNLALASITEQAAEHGNESEAWWQSALNRFLNVGTMIVTAGALHAKLPGQPEKPLTTTAKVDAYTKPVEPALEVARAFEAKDMSVLPSETSRLAADRSADVVAASALGNSLVDGLSKAASFGGRFPLGERFIRNMFDPARADAKVSIDKQAASMMPLRMEVDKAGRELFTFLDQKTGSDPAMRRELMHALWTEVEGRGDISSMYRSKFSKATITEGKQRLQTWAEKGLAIGIRGEKENWIPTAVYQDASGTKTSIMQRDIIERRYSPEDMAAGRFGKLVGGVEFYRQAGGYLPHLSALAEQTSHKPWNLRARGKSFAPATIEGYLPDEFIRQRLISREKTTPEFVEALAKGGRNVDTSYESIAETYQREIQSVQRKAVLEDARASGNLRKGNALPSDVEAETMRAQVIELDGKIGDLREEYRGLNKKTDKSRRSAINFEIADLKEHQKQLRLGLDGRGWTKMEGKEWGEYDSLRDRDGPGWYLRSDLHQAVKPLPTQINSIMELGSTLHRMAKVMKTGFSAGRRFMQDKLGNAIVYRDAGLFDATENARSMRDNFRLRMKGEAPADKTHEEFLAVSAGHWIASAGEMQALDAQRFAKADQYLKEAQSKGDLLNAIPLSLNKWASFFEAVLGKAPVIGTTARFYKSVVDEADALSGFRVARKRGLSVEEAWEEVAPIADYSTLPDGVQKAATLMSFIRYPAQMGRAYAKKIAPRPATFYGVNVGRGLGLDAKIQADPHSKGAQAAMMTRSVLNMFAKFGEWTLPIAVSTKALLAQQGISEDEWESYLNQQYKESYGPIAGMQKMLALPTGRTELGRISHLDLSLIVPWMAPLTFWKGHPEGGHIMQAISKNVLLSPWGQALYNRDFRMSTPEQGVMPGERWYGVATQFIPGLLTATMNEIVANENLPNRERSLLRVAARSLGVPLKVGQAENPLRAQVEAFRKAGLIQYVEGEDGSEMYGVTNRYSPLAPFLDTLIQLYYAAPTSQYQATQRIEGKIKRLQEAPQLR